MTPNLDTLIQAALEEAKRIEAQAHRMESASWSQHRPEDRAESASFARILFAQAAGIRESAHQCTMGNL